MIAFLYMIYNRTIKITHFFGWTFNNWPFMLFDYWRV